MNTTYIPVNTTKLFTTLLPVPNQLYKNKICPGKVEHLQFYFSRKIKVFLPRGGYTARTRVIQYFKLLLPKFCSYGNAAILETVFIAAEVCAGIYLYNIWNKIAVCCYLTQKGGIFKPRTLLVLSVLVFKLDCKELCWR